MDAAHRERLEQARLRNIEYMRKCDVSYTTTTYATSNTTRCLLTNP